MTHPAAAETPLPLEETLRVIGQVLDAARARDLSLTVEAAGVSFAGGVISHRQYGWAEIAGLVRAHRAQRRPHPVFRPWLDPWRATRWSVWLRITGRLLDARDIHKCRLEARLGPTLEENRLKVWVAAEQVLDETVVSRELAAVWMEQDLLQPDAPPSLPQRRWWRRWWRRA
jgi:hypothetical protein